MTASILVGGVSELFQSDLDLGRLAVERLQSEGWGEHVLVEDLHYGAVAVMQRFEDLRPETLVLISAVRRDRTPGCVERRRIDPAPLSAEDLQVAVGDAVTGYVHVDLIIDVATGLGALPPRTVVVEVEPERTDAGEGLSEPGKAGLEQALDMVRAEIRRAPLLSLAEALRALVDGDRLEPSLSRTALRDLLDELRVLDREGRWGGAFSLRDRLRLRLAHSDSSEGMDPQDWALWWGLIEEIDRLEREEVAGGLPA